MTAIIIAGKPNVEATSECILLAKNVENAFPTSRFIIVLKHPDEWNNYSEDICNLFGLYKNTHPLIFKANGKSIGGKDEFFKYIRDTYKYNIFQSEDSLLIDPSIIQRLTQENMAIVDREYTCRTKGSTIQDKIEQKLNVIPIFAFEKQFDRYNTIDSSFQIDYMGEMKVFYKVHEKFGPLDCVDCMEYIEYQNPLENITVKVLKGKVTESNVLGLSTSQNKMNTCSQGQQSLSGMESQVVGAEIEDNEGDEEDEENAEEKRAKEIKFSYYKQFEVPRHTLSNFDDIVISINSETKYQLILNPYFTFYGETLLYHNEEEKADIIKDYGRMPSLRKIIYNETTIPFIKNIAPLNQLDYSPNSQLDSNIYNVTDFFFTENDIKSMINSVNEINGVVSVRILPYKYNDHKHFGSSIIKIIRQPIKEIGNEDYPLELKIEQTIRSIMRNQMGKAEPPDQFGANTISVADKKNDMLNSEDFLDSSPPQRFFTIDAYRTLGIKHLVRAGYTSDVLNVFNLCSDLKEMFKQLEITNETGLGFAILLTSKFLFMAPLVNPFAFTRKGVPIFAEPHFFAGIFTLPKIEAEWPESLKGEYVEFDLAEVLRKTTNI